MKRHAGNLMRATQVFTCWCRIFNLQSGSHTFPDNVKHVWGSRHLEVINIYNKEDLGFTVPVAGAPLRNGREPNGDELFFTVALPVAPRIRMSIQGLTEWHNGITVF
jgi:hypothetical protein